MIKIANPYISTTIILSYDFPFLLIVENPHEYWKTVIELQKAMNGEISNFTFWKEEEEMLPSKYGEMLCELFSFDLCDKKISNLLLKQLQNNFQNGDFIFALQEIQAKTELFLQSLSYSVDFALEYDTMTLDGMLKQCNIRPAQNYDSVLEKIICYINIYLEFKKIDFFIFVGIKQILTDDELLQLYHHCTLKKVYLFIIEPTKSRSLLPLEKAIIITEDLCEIVENIIET